MISTSDIARRLYEENQADFKSYAAAERAVKTVFNEVSNALGEGEDVRVHGFGTFGVKTRAARKGVNLQTGESMDIPEKQVVRFKPGKNLSEKVQ